MRLFVIYTLLFTMTFTFGQEGVAFSPDQQFYLKGSSTIIGNSILSVDDTKPYNDISGINDLLKLQYVDIDNDRKTFSSSSALLRADIDPSKIKYAAIYWSAIYKYEKGKQVVVRTDNGKKTSQRIVYDGKDLRSQEVNKVLFKLPNGNYNEINGSVIFDSYTTKLFADTKPYVCYADVTSLMTSQKSLNGAYTMANIKATEGFISGGASGGWLLYIIYEDDNEPSKFFTTFNGFVEIAEKPVDITFTGFSTNGIGKVQTSLSLGVLEGDQKIQGDDCLFFDTNSNTFVPLSTALRPKNNFFNGSITVEDKWFVDRIPNSSNNLGFDLVKQSVPYINPSTSANKLDKSTFRFKTSSDRFYLFFVAFETEISSVMNTASSSIALKDNGTLKTTNDLVEIRKSTNSFEVTKTEATHNTDDRPIDLPETQEEAIERIVALESITVPNLPKGYYLITNVFAKEKNAMNWMKFLLDKGYNPGVYVNPINQWHYIYIDDNEDPLPIYLKREKLSTLEYFKDIWIHKINFIGS